jgi:hypothetical protein
VVRVAPADVARDGEALSNQPLALGFTPINDLGTIQSPVSNRTALLHCREADQKRP